MYKLTIFFSSFLFAASALACSCSSISLLENWEKNKHIFVAKVSEIQIIRSAEPDTIDEGLERGSLDVLTLFKGKPSKVTHLQAAHSPVCCTCSTKLSKEKYLVFTNVEGSLPINSCSSTGRLQYLPYHEEVLMNLKSNAPTSRYIGIYNGRFDQILIEDELRVAEVIEFTGAVNDEKFYVDIEAYPLSDGSLFYLKTHSSISLTAITSDQ